MDGRLLYRRIRGILYDQVTANEQGEFWKDDEIGIALNSAQDLFLNRMLNASDKALLSGLLTSATFLANPGTLPADYLHYASATITDDNAINKTARVYLGGNGISYLTVAHEYMTIINTEVWMGYRDVVGAFAPATTGVLYYYKRPTKIIKGIFDNSFPDNIYYNEIVKLGTALLGMKETQTQREHKILQSSQKDYGMRSKDFVIYPPTGESEIKFTGGQNEQRTAPRERAD